MICKCCETCSNGIGEFCAYLFLFSKKFKGIKECVNDLKENDYCPFYIKQKEELKYYPRKINKYEYKCWSGHDPSTAFKEYK